jgi:hypothetical protein
MVCLPGLENAGAVPILSVDARHAAIVAVMQRMIHMEGCTFGVCHRFGRYLFRAYRAPLGRCPKVLGYFGFEAPSALTRRARKRHLL